MKTLLSIFRFHELSQYGTLVLEGCTDGLGCVYPVDDWLAVVVSQLECLHVQGHHSVANVDEYALTTPALLIF